MNGTLSLQGVTLTAGNQRGGLEFKVSSHAERRCVDKLNEVVASHNGTLNLTASSDGKVNMLEVCHQMDQIVQSSSLLSESQKFELRSFLASQARQVKRAALGVR